jgi:hypothetical protein
MVFVQYFCRGLVSGELTPVCGDRAVVVLDGRQSLETWKNDATVFNGYRRPTYDAYQIFKGRNFSDCKPITSIIQF